ncbi:hypothetical protein SADUNF_Sadunf01G0093000 [Salix dunnii]|uniref:Uncharacterized protein n=1 Tax=Salix dunnii TaxID=1413687 RepID=A0A835TJR2_9ROSI|nr:hypothetical protein SADUNF_Sadunf01G0093000 [Salix dunnii]
MFLNLTSRLSKKQIRIIADFQFNTLRLVSLQFTLGTKIILPTGIKIDGPTPVAHVSNRPPPLLKTLPSPLLSNRRSSSHHNPSSHFIPSSHRPPSPRLPWHQSPFSSITQSILVSPSDAQSLTSSSSFFTGLLVVSAILLLILVAEADFDGQRVSEGGCRSSAGGFWRSSRFSLVKGNYEGMMVVTD